MAQEKCNNLLSTYSTLVNELAPCRKQAVQAGEEACEFPRLIIWITWIAAYMVLFVTQPRLNRLGCKSRAKTL